MSERLKKALAGLRTPMSKRRKRILEYSALLLCMVLLFTTVTYAWVRRKWTPKISQDHMQIVAGDSLVFALVGKEAQMAGESSLSTLIDLVDFQFRPVSNYSGTSDDFFALDASSYLNEYFQHLLPGGTVTAESYTQQGLNNGYIEFSLKVTGRDTTQNGNEDLIKYVFLSSDTALYLTEYPQGGLPENMVDSSKAFRMSITVSREGAQEAPMTYLFAPPDGEGVRTHRAITNATVTDENNQLIWLANGQSYRADKGEDLPWSEDYATNAKREWFYVEGEEDPYPLVETNPNVNVLSDYMGGYLPNNSGGAFDPDKCLFFLSPGQIERVTVRIWLEGEDPFCTEKIAAQYVSFLLGFEAHNVDPNAPETEAPEDPVETDEDL